MNYYYINGDAELWRQFKQLMDHICADVQKATTEGYPRLKEEK